MRQTIEITEERIARAVACRLTKYAPEQISEITAALADLEAAEAEYTAAVVSASSIYTPAEVYIGWQNYLPEPLGRLYDQANDTDRVTFDRGGRGAEAFPLSLWRQSARQFRGQSRRIRQAIQEAS